MSNNRPRDLLSLLNQIPSVMIYGRNGRIYIEFQMNDPRVLREIYVILQAFRANEINFSNNAASARSFNFSIANQSFYSSDSMQLDKLIRLIELFLYDSENSPELLKILRDFLHRDDKGTTGSGSPFRLNEVLADFYEGKKTHGIIQVDGDKTSKKWNNIASSNVPSTSIPNFYDDYEWLHAQDFDKFIRTPSPLNFEPLAKQMFAVRSKSNTFAKRVQDKLNISSFSLPTNRRNYNKLVNTNPLSNNWKFRVFKENTLSKKLKSVKRNLKINDKVKIHKDKLSSLLKIKL